MSHDVDAQVEATDDVPTPNAPTEDMPHVSTADREDDREWGALVGGGGLSGLQAQRLVWLTAKGAHNTVVRTPSDRGLRWAWRRSLR